MENLEKGLCPECDNFIYINRGKYICACGWKISKAEYTYLMKMKEKQNDEYYIPDYEENLQELNFLGRPKIK
jgi:hypothetical protein